MHVGPADADFIDHLFELIDGIIGGYENGAIGVDFFWIFRVRVSSMRSSFRLLIKVRFEISDSKTVSYPRIRSHFARAPSALSAANLSFIEFEGSFWKLSDLEFIPDWIPTYDDKKLKIPKNKHQITNKPQIPIFNSQNLMVV